MCSPDRFGAWWLSVSPPELRPVIARPVLRSAFLRVPHDRAATISLHLPVPTPMACLQTMPRMVRTSPSLPSYRARGRYTPSAPTPPPELGMGATSCSRRQSARWRANLGGDLIVPMTEPLRGGSPNLPAKDKCFFAYLHVLLPHEPTALPSSSPTGSQRRLSLLGRKIEFPESRADFSTPRNPTVGLRGNTRC
jgi:hypothetical protein